jgi:hypothetical protein
LLSAGKLAQEMYIRGMLAVSRKLTNRKGSDGVDFFVLSVAKTAPNKAIFTEYCIDVLLLWTGD